jgi:hypothetical protein
MGTLRQVTQRKSGEIETSSSGGKVSSVNLSEAGSGTWSTFSASLYLALAIVETNVSTRDSVYVYFLKQRSKKPALIIFFFQI